MFLNFVKSQNEINRACDVALSSRRRRSRRQGDKDAGSNADHGAGAAAATPTSGARDDVTSASRGASCLTELVAIGE